MHSHLLRYCNTQSINPLAVLTLTALSLLTACASNIDPQKELSNIVGTLQEPIMECKALEKIHLEGVKINSVMLGAIPNSEQVWCRVEISKMSEDGRKIDMWYALPHQGWNGRFLGTGGAGYSGGFTNFDAQTTSAYVMAATDAGRGGRGWDPVADASFAIDNEQNLDWTAIENFGHLAVHQMTMTGKALVTSYYGSLPRFSYFSGCSQGGRQGMMEAQKYPEDYDGIMAGAPAFNSAKFPFIGIWQAFVMSQNNHTVSACKLNFATQSAINACDLGDGLVDGLISNPQTCQFDANSLVGANEDQCETFSAADAEIVNSIWQGPKTKNGEFLWYGVRPGAPLMTIPNATGSVSVTEPEPLAVDWIKYFVAQDRDWKWQDMTHDDLKRLFDRSVTLHTEGYAADNPNLDLFQQHNGKILMWHGEADHVIPADGSIEYYSKVKARVGDEEKTNRFFRLFMAPGVGHCEGGNGPLPHQTLEAIVDWVENDVAPQTLQAKSQNGPERTRPLCLHPRYAKYNGSGDINSSDSFTCTMN